MRSRLNDHAGDVRSQALSGEAMNRTKDLASSLRARHYTENSHAGASRYESSSVLHGVSCTQARTSTSSATDNRKWADARRCRSQTFSWWAVPENHCRCG